MHTVLTGDYWSLMVGHLSRSDVYHVQQMCTRLRNLLKEVMARPQVQPIIAGLWIKRMDAEGLAKPDSIVATWVRSRGTDAAGREAYVAMRALYPYMSEPPEEEPTRLPGLHTVPGGVMCELLHRCPNHVAGFASDAWPYLPPEDRPLCARAFPWTKELSDEVPAYDFPAFNTMLTQLVELGLPSTVVSPTDVLCWMVTQLSRPAILKLFQTGVDLEEFLMVVDDLISRPDSAELIRALLPLIHDSRDRNQIGEAVQDHLLADEVRYESLDLDCLRAVVQAGLPARPGLGLQLITLRGNAETIQCVHDLGLWRPGDRDDRGQTALHLMGRHLDRIDGDEAETTIKSCQLLLDLGEEINAVDRYGSTPLFGVLGRETADGAKVVRYFETQGADFNVVAERRWSVLHQYCLRPRSREAGHDPTLELLVNLCRHRFLKNQYGDTPATVFIRNSILPGDVDLRDLHRLQQLIVPDSQCPLVDQLAGCTPWEYAMALTLLGRTDLLAPLLPERWSSRLEGTPNRVDDDGSDVETNSDSDEDWDYSPNELLAIATRVLQFDSTLYLVTRYRDAISAEYLLFTTAFLYAGQTDNFDRLIAASPCRSEVLAVLAEDGDDIINWLDELRNPQAAVAAATYMRNQAPAWSTDIYHWVHPDFPDLLDELHTLNPDWFQHSKLPQRMSRAYLNVSGAANLEAATRALEKVCKWNNTGRVSLFASTWRSFSASIFALPPAIRKRYYAAVDDRQIGRRKDDQISHDANPLAEILEAFIHFPLGREHWLEVKPMVDAMITSGPYTLAETFGPHTLSGMLAALHWNTGETRNPSRIHLVTLEDRDGTFVEVFSHLRNRLSTPDGFSSTVKYEILKTILQEAPADLAIVDRLLRLVYEHGPEKPCSFSLLVLACRAGRIGLFDQLIEDGAEWNGGKDYLVVAARSSCNFEMMMRVRRLVGVK